MRVVKGVDFSRSRSFSSRVGYEVKMAVMVGVMVVVAVTELDDGILFFLFLP